MSAMTLVEVDLYLEVIERAAERLSAGNVAHDGPQIRALIRDLRRRIGTRKFKQEVSRG